MNTKENYLTKGEIMKLQFKENKPNTKTIQFRIDPTTHQMLTALKKFHKVRTGELIKEMIKIHYKEIMDQKIANTVGNDYEI